MASLCLVAAVAPAAAQQRTFKPDRTERLLSAAGFEAIPANTPERAAELAAMKPNRLVAQPNGGSFTYVYADPDGCNCLYMGDAADYSTYQKLALNARIAQQNADAASDARFSSLNWGLWGPYPRWGWVGPVFVHGGGFHGGDHDGDHDGGHGRR
jgi:hypothetical protein